MAHAALISLVLKRQRSKPVTHWSICSEDRKDALRLATFRFGQPRWSVVQSETLVSSVQQFSAQVGFENALVGGPFISFCRG